MIISYDFGLVEWTRPLKGGGTLVISGTRQPDGGLRVVEVRHIPAAEQVTHDQLDALAA